MGLKFLQFFRKLGKYVHKVQRANKSLMADYVAGLGKLCEVHIF
jgi:putative heme degradation protein